jgi:adenosine deaminase
MKKTVHAGEAYGPESIFQAITECHADRIGHGTFLFAADKVKDPTVKDPDYYVKCLVDYIASRRITLEVCPTSNLQTIPTITSVADHPLKKMLDANLSVSICTDNRLVSRTSVTRELELVCSSLPVTPAQLRNIILAGFKGSFFHGPYGEKRALVRQVSQRYDALEQQYLGTSAG